MPDNYSSQAPQTTNAENSFAMVASVWWSFVWRFLALSIGINFILTLGFTIVLRDPQQLELVSTIISMLVAIPVSFWSVGAALNKKHRGYKIVFTKLPTEESPHAEH